MLNSHRVDQPPKSVMHKPGPFEDKLHPGWLVIRDPAVNLPHIFDGKSPVLRCCWIYQHGFITIIPSIAG